MDRVACLVTQTGTSDAFRRQSFLFSICFPAFRSSSVPFYSEQRCCLEMANSVPAPFTWGILHSTSMNAVANSGVVSHVVNTESGKNGSHGRTSDEQLLVPARLSHISVSCIGYYGSGMASSISSVPTSPSLLYPYLMRVWCHVACRHSSVCLSSLREHGCASHVSCILRDVEGQENPTFFYAKMDPRF